MKFYQIALTMALLLGLALFVACGDDDDADPTDAPSSTGDVRVASATGETSGDEFPLTFIDDAGVETTLDAAPERIVALAPSFVEVLFEFGVGESIVAADQNTDFPPEAESIPRISGFEPSVEGIASYDPDLVMMCCFAAGGLQDALTALGIPTVYFDTPPTLDGVYEQIGQIGQITGRSTEASAVVEDMKGGIDAVVTKVEGGDAPSVFFELDPALYTVGPGSFPDDVLTLLGATNVAESTGESYPQLSSEAVIAADPGVIILADGDFGESPETVAARPGWSALSAVTNQRIYAVPGGFLNHASPRVVTDIEALAGHLYPEN